MAWSEGNVRAVPLQVNVTLSLPRDELTVPVVRHLCNAAMTELGVVDGCRGDILLALTEACTNVVDHSVDGHDYIVQLMLDERRCTIDVKDEGQGFELDHKPPDLDLAENGRGIDLMHALVDKVSFTFEPQAGTIVHLYKNLEFVDDHPVRDRLLNR
jgi:serine/threonine-protein kinase RsbW